MNLYIDKAYRIGQAGVFISGWIDDAASDIALALSLPGGRTLPLASGMVRVTRKDLEQTVRGVDPRPGFIAFAAHPELAKVGGVQLGVMRHQGEPVTTSAELAPAPALGALRDFLLWQYDLQRDDVPAVMARVLGPCFSYLLASLRPPAAPTGRRVQREAGRTAFVIEGPVADAVLRVQLSTIAALPVDKRILVVTSTREDAERANWIAQPLAHACAIAVEVLMAGALDLGARLGPRLAESGAGRYVFLSHAVVAPHGALTRLLTALSRAEARRAVYGLTSMGVDGAICDAGLRVVPDAAQTIRLVGPTGVRGMPPALLGQRLDAADVDSLGTHVLALRAERFDTLGGFGAPFLLDARFWRHDLCLRNRVHGGETRRLAEPAVYQILRETPSFAYDDSTYSRALLVDLWHLANSRAVDRVEEVA